MPAVGAHVNLLSLFIGELGKTKNGFKSLQKCIKPKEVFIHWESIHGQISIRIDQQINRCKIVAGEFVCKFLVTDQA